MTSKRQQARNERALQDLIRSIPGNDVCADCSARNPGWASYSVGCFLCLRCAAIHRKMGTHVSKVKSLSMDKWTDDQVDQMKMNGNNLVNKKYNPRNVRPKIPIDADEVDSVMERFIRQKYQEMSLSDGRPRPPSRDDRDVPRETTYSRSPEASPPPPLPPKKGKLFSFGLRSTSAAYPSMSKHDKKRMTTEHNPTENAFHAAKPPLQSKQSRVFGANVGEQENMETKLATLRDMGFPDNTRNSTMLKSLNGDLERTIESLVRLGEGSQPGSRSRTPNRTPRDSIRGTPTSSTFPDTVKNPALMPPSNTNPFDKPSGGTVGLSLVPPSAEQKPANSFNPFGIPPDPQVLEQSLSNLQISQQPQQPLFPHSTGGYPSQQPVFHVNRLQQSMTPPVPSTYNPFFQSMQSSQTSSNPYAAMMHSPQSTTSSNNPFLGQGFGTGNVAQSPQPVEQYGQPSQASYNPFQAQFSSQQQATSSAPPAMPVQSQSFSQPQPQSTNPFGTSFGNQGPGGMVDLFSDGHTAQQQSTIQQPPTFQQAFQSQPVQQQQQIPSQPSQMQPMPNTTSQNPYQQLHTQPQQSQFSSAPLITQQTGRYDKSSILALYNYPHLAPPLPTILDDPSQVEGASAQQTAPTSMANQIMTATSSLANNANTPQRSATMPLPTQSHQPPSQSRNPFLTDFQSPGANLNNSSFTPLTTTTNTGISPASTTGAINTASPFANIGIVNRSRSRESADLAGLQNGRHSPDAFASLSARYGRS